MKNEKLKNFFSSRTAKSVAVFAVVLLIGVAVYVNYRLFYDPTGSMGYGDGNMSAGQGDSLQTGADAEGEKTYEIVLKANDSYIYPISYNMVAGDDELDILDRIFAEM